jgi:hypothetical protein
MCPSLRSYARLDVFLSSLVFVFNLTFAFTQFLDVIHELDHSRLSVFDTIFLSFSFLFDLIFNTFLFSEVTNS